LKFHLRGPLAEVTGLPFKVVPVLVVVEAVGGWRWAALGAVALVTGAFVGFL